MPIARRAPFAVSVLLLTVFLWSCQTPEAVSKFAQQAADSLQRTPAVFNDLAASCDRRVASQGELTPAWETNSPPPSSAASACAEISEQSKGFLVESDVLQNYFVALKEVAAFGSAEKKDGAAGGDSGAKKPPALAANLENASDLARITGKLAGERYQRKHLQQIVASANPDVQAITASLETNARKRYGDELRLEQENLTDHFIAFGKKGDANNPAILYSLNYIYVRELADIHQRRASADAYADAMAKIRAGHNELASGNDKLGLKDLEAAADRYSAELQQLGGIISKQF